MHDDKRKKNTKMKLSNVACLEQRLRAPKAPGGVSGMQQKRRTINQSAREAPSNNPGRSRLCSKQNKKPA